MLCKFKWFAAQQDGVNLLCSSDQEMNGQNSENDVVNLVRSSADGMEAGNPEQVGEAQVNEVHVVRMEVLANRVGDIRTEIVIMVQTCTTST